VTVGRWQGKKKRIMKNAKIGTAVLGGYVLGRTKKAKLAIGLGALLAGSRIRPGQLGKTLQGSPFVNTLTKQVRTELTDAGKAAATSVLTAKADSLADRLHERTVGLQEKAHGAVDRATEVTGVAGGTEEDEEEEANAEESRGEKGRDEDDEPRGERGKTRRTSSSGTKKASTAQSRSRSGTSRSRRPDDG
jgi:hypothetical protein